MNKLESIYIYLSMNLFMRTQWESHLSSRLWRSVATHWLGRSHSCLDPHWLSPGSDSSGTSLPHPPWYNKSPVRLSVVFDVALVLVSDCDYGSCKIPETPASVRCAIPVFPHSHHLPASKRLSKTDRKRALNVQDGRCPLWIYTLIREFKPLKWQKHISLFIYQNLKNDFQQLLDGWGWHLCFKRHYLNLLNLNRQ